jgi:ABC-type sugar transport system ATPase subunit
VQTISIQVADLQKSYKDLNVLKGVNFTVERGSIFALLGSNGAGKTTLIKILTTLLKQDGGTAIVNGFDVASKPAHVRQSLSLTGQSAAVDEMLTGRENLIMIARLQHVKQPRQVTDDLLTRFGSVVVIILVALIMGFRSSAGFLSWLTVVGILALFTLALTWVAVIAGLTAKSTDGAAAFSYPLIFLPFISSAFVPTRSMPPVVRAFAENQPVTAIVNTIRALLSGQPVSQDIWVALAWCVGILVVAYTFAMRAYQKRV